MKYIGDSIGMEYEKWKFGEGITQEGSIDMFGDTIFISSPTGSGKTTFILKKLLPYLVEKKKRVLYLVNRTILKKQLEEKIKSLPFEQRLVIEVELYQTIERKISNLQLQEKASDYLYGYAKAVEDMAPIDRTEHILFLQQNVFGHTKTDYFADEYNHLQRYHGYDCVVCDEAHYFLMDSNYNTNTVLSYNFIRDFFGKKLRIYISTTIEQIKEVVEKDNDERKYYRTGWLGIHTDATNSSGILASRKGISYSAERDYGYIDVGILRKREDIAYIVANGTEKWLIFVDSKEFGKKLMNDIKRLSKKEKSVNRECVAFITSDYELDSESRREVNTIIDSNKQLARVLITTSVLDNGINIEDIEVKNIIIVADTETEFIQMLGRKRNDNERLKLYIYKHTREHFARRQRINQKRLNIAEQNYMIISNIIRRELYGWNSRGKDGAELERICLKEKELMDSQHKILLQRIMNNEEDFENVRTSFLAFEGILRLNLLSFKNLENLGQFYHRILYEFDTYGENAFLREQLHWLNKTDDEADEIIFRENKSQFEKSKENVIGKLEQIENQPLSRNDFIKNKNEMRDDLVVLIDSVDKEHRDYSKYMGSVKRADRPISKQFMSFLEKNCDIPFRLEVEKSMYTVKSIKD